MNVVYIFKSGPLNIFPALDPRVRRFLGVLRYPPGASDHDNAGDAPLFAEDLDAAGGDPPLLGHFFDGQILHKNLPGLRHVLRWVYYSRKSE